MCLYSLNSVKMIWWTESLSLCPSPSVFVLLRRATACRERFRLFLFHRRFLSLAHFRLCNDLGLFNLVLFGFKFGIARARFVVFAQVVGIIAGVVGDGPFVKRQNTRRNLTQKVTIMRNGNHSTFK